MMYYNAEQNIRSRVKTQVENFDICFSSWANLGTRLYPHSYIKIIPAKPSCEVSLWWHLGHLFSVNSKRKYWYTLHPTAIEVNSDTQAGKNKDVFSVIPRVTLINSGSCLPIIF